MARTKQTGTSANKIKGINVVPKVNSKKSISKNQVKKTSRSERAGLNFPVGRIDRKLRKTIVNKRVGAGAAVFLAAIMEYMSAELIDLANIAAVAHKKLRITPRFLQLAIRGDEELSKMFSRVMIAQGGVMPKPIHESLLPQKK